MTTTPHPPPDKRLENSVRRAIGHLEKGRLVPALGELRKAIEKPKGVK